jgi:hypothetical protein
MDDDTIAHAVSIQVTIMPDDPDNPDPASVSNAASNIIEALNAAGYITTAVPTGTKGDFLYTLSQLGQWTWEQREFLVGLAGALASIVSICQSVWKDREPDKLLTHIVIKTGDAETDISTERAELEGQILDILGPVLNHPTPPKVTVMVIRRVRGRSRRRR